MKKIISILAALAALMALAGCGKTQNVALAGIKVGQTAPDITVELYGGDTFTLSQQLGKPVVLNFFTTWCPPCQREMPDFQAIFEAYGERVSIIAVSSGEEAGMVNDFIAEKGFSFPIAYDSDRAASKAYGGIVSIPQTWIIDAGGVIVDYVPQMTSAAHLKEVLDGLL
ncbi:MAG: TlpA family protein disulfide reductase [Oscillospiraceae bacterium]|nr:TlpA family protein disulfide reductase [Oscillospiraceae bacterium]